MQNVEHAQDHIDEINAKSRKCEKERKNERSQKHKDEIKAKHRKWAQEPKMK